MNKLKKHLRKYKVQYACAATAIATAGITCLIVRGRYAEIRGVSDGSAMTTVRPLSFLSNRTTQTTNVVSVIEREGAGHPGYIVRCLETNQLFPSQKAAADALGIPASAISGQINGKIDLAEGLHFERVMLEAKGV